MVKKKPFEVCKDIAFPAIVATGCARSGTSFLANLLTQGGVICNHETYYGMPGFGEWRDGAIAECSWLAVPHLEREKLRGAKIIHIIRHPLKHISSMAHVHTLEDHNFRANIYSIFKELFFPTIRRLRVKDRYLLNWIKWNQWAEKYADLTYRLEDLIKNPQELFDDLGIDVKDVKFDTSKKNSYSNVKQYDWADFRDCLYYNELIQNAWRYKYITKKERDDLMKLKVDKLNVKK